MDKQLITFLQLLRPISEGDARLISSCFAYKIFTEGDYVFGGGRVCRDCSLFAVDTGHCVYQRKVLLKDIASYLGITPPSLSRIC